MYSIFSALFTLYVSALSALHEDNYVIRFLTRINFKYVIFLFYFLFCGSYTQDGLLRISRMIVFDVQHTEKNKYFRSIYENAEFLALKIYFDSFEKKALWLCNKAVSYFNNQWYI